MNRQTLRTYVRRYLQEAGTGRYDDALLNEEISRSARSLAGQLGLIQREVTGTTDAQGRLSVPDLVNVTGRVRHGQCAYDLPVIGYGDVHAYDARGWAAGGAVRALVVDEGALGPGVVALWPSPGAGMALSFMAFTDGGPLLDDTAQPWGGRYDTHHDVIAYHAAHALIAHNGTRAATDPAWWQRYQLRLEELRDRGSAGALTGGARMGSGLLTRRTTWR